MNMEKPVLWERPSACCVRQDDLRARWQREKHGEEI